MITEKDYCDYKTCVALKELGYVGSSRYYYTQRDHQFHYDAYNKFYTVRTADAMGYVLAVHLYDAQKWLREEKGLFIEISIFLGKYDLDICNTKVEGDKTHKILCEICGFETYEEALSEGVRASIKMLKEK